ncbi:hypothetical protein A2V49_03015 [candidate division WWE3 bacterium RBG_19FT_COMBO_34_6]|uniref:16S rRNA (Guanine(966)-N(2))-methyltransferase RsmD n=1 Tax=candidate division WWE3 bacterium RBG_19FT_COMBO_34_6 TaxID=1802612 RepID=A0A1F4ULH8_UNCKA|nr:MAG: hypothetical protein A2V49_03015 [candidate division WWE3 bacterium RBG_19FT_COMBO_34_6]
MIRIITGTVKNKHLKTPKIENFRAVQEIAKGSVFSIIGDGIKDSYCLDLFAGSGNMGLEALSRGANFCDFVDNNYEAKNAIQDNINNCNFKEKAEFHFKDSVKFTANIEKKYDFIFLDPFYEDVNHIFLLKNCEGIIKNDGLIIYFHGLNLDIGKLIKNTSFKVTDERKFGKSMFSILKKG